MKDKIKYILIFLSYFVYNLFISDFLNIFNININKISYIQKNIFLFIIDMIYLIFIILIYKKYLRKEFITFKKNWKNLLIKYFPVYVMGIFLMAISNIILTKFTGINLSNNEETIRNLIKVFPIYITFSSVIYAPFVEELIFRKTIRNIIKDDTLFILLSGFIFGIIHVINSDVNNINEILMGIPYIIMGIDFAYIFYKSKNIYTTITLHLSHNLILMIIQLIGG